jgi:hypothetical protein
MQGQSGFTRLALHLSSKLRRRRCEVAEATREEEGKMRCHLREEEETACLLRRESPETSGKVETFF